MREIRDRGAQRFALRSFSRGTDFYEHFKDNQQPPPTSLRTKNRSHTVNNGWTPLQTIRSLSRCTVLSICAPPQLIRFVYSFELLSNHGTLKVHIR